MYYQGLWKRTVYRLKPHLSPSPEQITDLFTPGKKFGSTIGFWSHVVYVEKGEM